MWLGVKQGNENKKWMKMNGLHQKTNQGNTQVWKADLRDSQVRPDGQISLSPVAYAGAWGWRRVAKGAVLESSLSYLLVISVSLTHNTLCMIELLSKHTRLHRSPNDPVSSSKCSLAAWTVSIKDTHQQPRHLFSPLLCFYVLKGLTCKHTISIVS